MLFLSSCPNPPDEADPADEVSTASCMRDSQDELPSLPRGDEFSQAYFPCRVQLVCQKEEENATLMAPHEGMSKACQSVRLFTLGWYKHTRVSSSPATRRKATTSNNQHSVSNDRPTVPISTSPKVPHQVSRLSQLPLAS